MFFLKVNNFDIHTSFQSILIFTYTHTHTHTHTHIHTHIYIYIYVIFFTITVKSVKNCENSTRFKVLRCQKYKNE